MQNSNLQPQTKELFQKLDQSTKTNKDSLAASQKLLEKIKKNNEENLQVLNQTTVVQNDKQAIKELFDSYFKEVEPAVRTLIENNFVESEFDNSLKQVFELLELKLSQQNYLTNKLHIKLQHRDVNDLQSLLEQAASSNEKLCSIEEFLERQIRPYD